MRAQTRDPSASAAIDALSRLLLSVIFILSGIGKIATPAGTLNMIAQAGLPLPHVAYWTAIVVELGGGIALLLGLQTRVAAVVLALFALVTGALFHNDIGNPIQAINLLKNIAIAGGLLHVAAWRPGRWTLDAVSARSRIDG